MHTRMGIYLMFLCLAGVVGCKKNKEPLKPTNGIYRGVFSRIVDDGDDTSGTGIVFLALNDFDSTFTLTGDTSSNAPFSCYGEFSLIGKDKISFTNKAALSADMEDPFYVLDTIYEYEFLDSNFFLKFKFSEETLFGADEVTIYDYNLARF